MEITIKNCRPALKSELEKAIKKTISKAKEGEKSYKLSTHIVHGTLRLTDDQAVFVCDHADVVPAKEETEAK